MNGKKRKLFGFRSGTPWKMTLAAIYYLGCTAFFLIRLAGRPAMAAAYEITARDLWVWRAELVLLWLLCMSPAILISDFRLRDRLLLLRRHDARYTTIAMTLACLLILIVYTCVGYLHTTKYRLCDKAYKQGYLIAFHDDDTYTVYIPDGTSD